MDDPRMDLAAAELDRRRAGRGRACAIDFCSAGVAWTGAGGARAGEPPELCFAFAAAACAWRISWPHSLYSSVVALISFSAFA